ncbi:MAG: C2 domain-containing protein [Deltaproteobacteria bacterium]|nr:C2 domain-containing protein [Deltaproteobacteria bacterium]
MMNHRCSGLLVFFLLVAACGAPDDDSGELEPRAGDACSGHAGCSSFDAALYCSNNILVSVPCRGPGHCVQDATHFECDMAGNSVGDPCPSQMEGLGMCDGRDDARVLVCQGGALAVFQTCEGRCLETGGQVGCDATGPDPSSRWRVTVTNGTLPERDPNGSAWDAAGGLPDPYVCLTVGTSPRWCTSTKQDTLNPVWNESSGTAYLWSALGDVRIEVFDEDLTDSEAVSSGSIPLQPQTSGQSATIPVTWTGGQVTLRIDPA